jgi:signal recognition particle receptor subunit beta
MVSINYSSREVCCKIVYYGPGLSGKTTNLLYVHSKVPSDTRGKMISLATEADRTLYFDFLPINIGTINGFAAKFQLYTVPGQVYYNATRKLVLRGVDGVVFVADSQPDKMEENIESLVNLEENLREYGYDINDLPMVIQYNKRDLPGVMAVDELNTRLNTRNLPHFEASATLGNGVFDTLKLIIKLVLEKAKRSATDRARPDVSYSEPAAEPPVPTPVQQEPDEVPSAPSEPATPERVPVEPSPVTAEAEPSGQAARSTEPISVAQAEPVAEAPAEQPEPSRYRPYPGGEDPEELDKKISSASFTPTRREEADDNAPAAEVAGLKTGQDSESADLSRPAMAPSLKRRGDKKKRGFIKRLFGIK